MSSLAPRERQLAATEGRHFQMRVMPYRTVQNVIDGVVLTFTDVTQIEQAQQALRNLNEDLKHFAYAASRSAGAAPHGDSVYATAGEAI